MDQYQPGDVIEHQLLPGYRMPVEDARPCETDPVRPEPHLKYQITDPDGNTDWLCAYDVQRPHGDPVTGDEYMTVAEFAGLSSDAQHAVWGAGHLIDQIPAGTIRRYHREQVLALLDGQAATAP